MNFFTKKSKTCQAVAFIFDYARKSRRNETYKRAYRCVARHLRSYEVDRNITIYSNTFSDNTAEDFIDFLKEKNLMLSTISGYFSKVSYMFRKMGKQKFEVDYSFEDYVVENEDAVTVIVSSEEIRRIAAMNIKTKERDIIRDRFVCNCLIGMRISDYSELTSGNIINNIIVRKTKKTGTTVEVPVHPIVREILTKHGGNFPIYNKSTQNYNKVIKNICKQAGLTDKVRWERTIGKKIVRKTYKRYELITSHTARRSFATNAYLSGIPIARIMLITGHKTEEAFFRYIRINKTENAKILSEHPFFQF